MAVQSHRPVSPQTAVIGAVGAVRDKELMMRSRILSSATLALLLGAVSAIAGCSARERRPVVVDAPVSAPTSPAAPAVQGPTVPNPLPVSPSNGSALPQEPTPPSPANASTAGATTPGSALPLPSGGAGALPTELMNITTQLEDGTPAALQWDGRAARGNDRWDVVPQ